MTTNELKQYLANTFGLNPWPETLEVDYETYANVCQSVFEWAIENPLLGEQIAQGYIEVCLGPNNGIMYKNVELILKRDK